MEKLEKKIWDEGFSLVYDTSSLLDFYFFPKKTRKNIYSNVFDKIGQNLWLPNHVYTEFLRNRENVISKTIQRKYEPLKKHLEEIDRSIGSIENKYEDIYNRTKKEDQHPHLDSEIVSKYSDIVSSFKEQAIQFHEELLDAITEIEEEIEKTIEDDDHLKAIDKYFKKGDEYNYSRLLEIVEEGEKRYRNSIPPGYKDLDNDSKKGFQIFGDLIIWKQLLEYSNKDNCNIIFVIDDQKEDWCEFSDETFHPRRELILEFDEFGGKNIWFYNQSNFLKTINEVLDTDVEDDDIDVVKEHLNEKQVTTKADLAARRLTEAMEGSLDSMSSARRLAEAMERPLDSMSSVRRLAEAMEGSLDSMSSARQLAEAMERPLDSMSSVRRLAEAMERPLDSMSSAQRLAEALREKQKDSDSISSHEEE